MKTSEPMSPRRRLRPSLELIISPRRLRTSMQGMGMMQIQSLTLSNQHDQFDNMRWTPAHEVTLITNPSVDHTMLRNISCRDC